MAVLSGACGQEVTAPRGEVLLESLRFTETEVEAGKPLVLFAQVASGEVTREQPLVVRASSGMSQQGAFDPQPTERPWDALSDAELAAVIGTWDTIVMIRFKDADAESGVDQHGQNITSKETVEQMKAWVREQGVTITREWITQPGVDGIMPADAALVSRLRAHESIDLVELGGIRGVFFGRTALQSSGDIVAVILTGMDEPSKLTVRAGDVVTAEYRQPNGAVLRATASVR
jgi:hypothetical protein